MNIIEKVLSRASNLQQVSPGEIVEANIDFAMVNEITGHLTIKYFKELGAGKVWDARKIVIVLDHTVPASTIEAAELHKIMRGFAREQKIKAFYDVGGGGVSHQIMLEKGHAKPGEAIVGADSHTCTYGAVGAFATGIGSTEMTAVFITGKLWFKVPKVIKINVTGDFKEFVTSKDLFLHVAKTLGVSGATYRGLEYAGPTIEKMSVESRMTICNMAIEVGAKAGIVEPDVKTLDYIKERSKEPFYLMRSDADSIYERDIEVDVRDIPPLVSCPDSVDNVKPISEIGEVELDQVFIGSCTNGRVEDLRLAAEILKGHKVSDRTRLIVIPASQQVYIDCLQQGIIEIFLLADAAVTSPTCGACYGGHLGALAAGETCLSTTNRNFVGRMGSPKSKVFLASPATAAASAIMGKITDPRSLERK